MYLDWLYQLVFIIIGWVVLQVVLFGGLLLSPAMQRNVIYIHYASKIALSPMEPPSHYGFHSLSRDGHGNEAPLKIRTEDGLDIEAWHITKDEKSHSLSGPFFLFFHGNGSHRARPQKILIYQNLFKTFPGSQILTIDYRGFSGSPGSPDQAGVLKDARAAWNYAINELGTPLQNIILIGQSLGSAITVHLLKQLNSEGIVPKATFLFCGFKSVPDVSIEYPAMKMLMPMIIGMPGLAHKLRDYIEDRWDALEVVKSGVQGPIVWLHGTDDQVVPYHHGASLRDAAMKTRNPMDDRESIEPIRSKVDGVRLTVWTDKRIGFIEIVNGGHDDMGNRPNIFWALRRFLDNIYQ